MLTFREPWTTEHEIAWLKTLSVRNPNAFLKVAKIIRDGWRMYDRTVDAESVKRFLQSWEPTVMLGNRVTEPSTPPVEAWR